MAKVNTRLSTKRFGPRYGGTKRIKVAKIESMQKQSYACPYCRYARARRLAAGIWYCSKCGAKFSGKAYSVARES